MEHWKDIPGYDGCYQVSNLGRVRSADRWAARHTVFGLIYVKHTGKPLRPAPNRTGHLTVVLGRGNTRHVHALVALAFIGPRPAGADVAHRDGNPANNTPGNLRYATRQENNQDRAAHGRLRLTIEQVQRVRREAPALPRGGKVLLARELNVSPATISDVLARRTYAYV